MPISRRSSIREGLIVDRYIYTSTTPLLYNTYRALIDAGLLIPQSFNSILELAPPQALPWSLYRHSDAPWRCRKLAHSRRAIMSAARGLDSHDHAPGHLQRRQSHRRICIRSNSNCCFSAVVLAAGLFRIDRHLVRLCYGPAATALVSTHNTGKQPGVTA